jgi:hypothetical protein
MRLTRRDRSQLPSQTAEAAFEVGDGELSVDGLLETSDGVDVKNNGRTGRDRCYTRIRHRRVSMGASPWNADLLITGRQGERAPVSGVNNQVPGLF